MILRFGIAAFLLAAPLLFVAALPAHAATCAGGCPAGYTCLADNQCVAPCSDGNPPAADGTCAVDTLTVSAPNHNKTTLATAVASIEKFADQYVIPLMYALAFLFFIFGMFRYFFTGGEENRQQGRAFVMWSIIGFVAIFALWGVVNLLLSVIPT